MNNNEVNWSALPSDILSLIKARLFAKDYVSFNSVCKTWRLASSPLTLSDDFLMPQLIQCPSLLYFYGDNPSCNLYNPLYNRAYVIDIPELLGAQILYSKYGWLLLSCCEKMFFFDPFTKQRIDLPNLPTGMLKHSFTRTCFSYPPTSDCMVFGIVDMPDSEVYVSYIRRGDDSWTNCCFDNMKRLSSSLLKNPIYCKRSFITSHNNPVFWNDLFYCSSHDGYLGIFDPKKDRWRILDQPSLPLKSLLDNFLVECNGDLVSVYVGHLGEYVRVFKLNQTGKAWKEVESLGDWMIFLSHTTSFSLPSKSLPVQGMENKIYFPSFHDRNNVFYSLSTCEFHSFEVGYRAEDLRNTSEYMNCTWIEPTFKLRSSDELDWLLTDPAVYDFPPSNPGQLCQDFIHSLTFKSTSRSAKGKARMKLYQEKQALEAHPWIIFSHGKDEEMQTFYDLSKGCYCVRNLKELRGKFIATGSHGWLLIVDKNTDDCFLLNPTSMEKIQLPSWETDFRSDVCVLTLPPNDPNCIVFFMGHSIAEPDDNYDEDESPKEEVAIAMFCRIGDCTWTIKAPTGQEKRRLHCATSYKGNIYGITKETDAFVIIEMNPTFTIREIVVDLPNPMFRGSCSNAIALVESCGELLALSNRYHGRKHGASTVIHTIEVSKMNFDTMIWEEVKDLGGRTFFRSFSCCSSFFPRESSRFKGNTIYWLDAIHKGRLYVFDIEDGSLSVSLPCPDLEDCSEAELIMVHP